jgi:aminopeptidase-like protein
MEKSQDMENIGQQIYNLAEKLFPINRSITGDGVRETLAAIAGVFPGLVIREVPSGTRVFDWIVPKEWNVKDAWIECPDGRRVAEFKKNNLHLVGYSVPVNKLMTLAELQERLYSLPDQPNAIPYVTSYYEERFGFCMAHGEREKLQEGNYRVFIDSELRDGSLTYGEIIIPGRSEKEIFWSSYICHPSMANNELSGPCIAAYLAKWLSETAGDSVRRFTHRVIFIPETIGAIAYLAKNLDSMKKNVIAGFNLTCLGDPGNFSYIASRYGNTLADKAARSVLRFLDPKYHSYSFLNRGSNERQYNAPGVDLPVCCLARTKFGNYPEYHTSRDDMNFITPDALGGSFGLCREIAESLEANGKYRVKVLCEPQLSRRGLYPTVSERGAGWSARSLTNFIAYCDGTNDLFDIGEIIGEPILKLAQTAKNLLDADLIEEITLT